jgi:RNA polymerase sigma-70 factor (ECF subfamily)
MALETETISDEQLAENVKAGNEAAFAEIMQRYEQKLTRYGNRFLAGQREDVLRQAIQDIFIAVYQNIEGFDKNQRFSPWIYRIAHNTFVDVLRSRTRQPLYGFDFDRLVSHPVEADSFAKEKENEELRVLLDRSLNVLPSAQREILVLYYFEELSYKEIADVLHVPLGTVGVRLARARTQLKKELPDSSNFVV